MTAQNPNSSTIYVVATPIGNLEDMSPRAINTLKQVDVIACEDTRVSRKLLAHFDIKSKELITYADHDEVQKAEALVDRLTKQTMTMALVSDAGTPCISDPGYRLVHLARKRSIPVIPIPGPSAPMALASVSGLPTDRILFIGFLPNKEAALISEINTWQHIQASIIFLESARRLDRTLKHIASIYPQALVCIGRELTKLYEEVNTLNVSEAAQWLSSHHELRGEVSVMLHIPVAKGKGAAAGVSINKIHDEAVNAFRQGETLKDLLQKYKDCGLNRSALYQLLLKAKNEV